MIFIEKVKCPYCGHEQSIFIDKNAVCKGVWLKCKGRQCGKEFEIVIKPKSR